MSIDLPVEKICLYHPQLGTLLEPYIPIWELHDGDLEIGRCVHEEARTDAELLVYGPFADSDEEEEEEGVVGPGSPQFSPVYEDPDPNDDWLNISDRDENGNSSESDWPAFDGGRPPSPSFSPRLPTFSWFSSSEEPRSGNVSDESDW